MLTVDLPMMVKYFIYCHFLIKNTFVDASMNCKLDEYALHVTQFHNGKYN